MRDSSVDFFPALYKGVNIGPSSYRHRGLLVQDVTNAGVYQCEVTNVAVYGETVRFLETHGPLFLVYIKHFQIVTCGFPCCWVLPVL